MKKDGLYGKFNVRRNDGRSEAGKKHEDCEYFVLDLIHDKHAHAAIRAYAESCANDLPKLADDLITQSGAMVFRGLVTGEDHGKAVDRYRHPLRDKST